MNLWIILVKKVHFIQDEDLKKFYSLRACAQEFLRARKGARCARAREKLARFARARKIFCAHHPSAYIYIAMEHRENIA